jgi:hypothetical protein
LAAPAVRLDDRLDRPKEEGLGDLPLRARIAAVLAFDEDVVARALGADQFPAIARGRCSIFDRFSAFATIAGASFTSARHVIAGRSTARRAAGS